MQQPVEAQVRGVSGSGGTRRWAALAEQLRLPALERGCVGGVSQHKLTHARAALAPGNTPQGLPA